MNKKAIWKEAAAVLSVAAVLIGVPLLLWYWRAVVVPGQYPPGTKIIHLTAIAPGGVWTEEQIVGYSYWWKKPARVENIPITQGDHVVLLLHSPDVHHSFSMPDLHIGPVDIHAGHTVEVQFDAKEPGELRFLCMQVCGHEHSHLEGHFLVAQREAAGKTNQGL